MSKISPKNIAEAIYKATEGKSGVVLAEILHRGAQMIQNKRMIGKSDEILKTLQNIQDIETGTVRAKVTTAKKISHEERNKIEHEVKEKYKGKSVVSEFFEKEELLGGMRVEVGDEVLDTSYKSALMKLKDFLIQAK
ncbi:MAG TPA: F0F1 ATP synthase subunit delta [Candidatus Paceibacterota bacterium]|nr:F0F1 ATP synthase subunit delta [Candidatus Paceibacterota bacterium]